tara:strand:+ start:375 stop:533 length:159 start_codon:yes stop_codon:yes gene_type:complete
VFLLVLKVVVVALEVEVALDSKVFFEVIVFLVSKVFLLVLKVVIVEYDVIVL